MAALSFRERGLILVTVLLLLLLPGYSLWLEPIWLHYQQLQQRESELTQSLQLQQQENQARRSRLQGDPNQPLGVVYLAGAVLALSILAFEWWSYHRRWTV